MRFPFIQAEKASYPVAVLCNTLEVSRSGFYAWIQRPESKRAVEDRRLSVLVQASFEESRKVYGSPRVLEDLVEQGERVSRKRVARLMRASGLKGRIRRRYKNTTMSDHSQPVAPNLLERRFEADLPNQRWVGDTTELLVGNGRLYLAVLIDLFSRYVVGWSLSTTNDRQLVITALEQALQGRRPERGLLHHSDQGSPYASEDYRRILDMNGLVCSMSRRGNCLDNAVAESWFSTLKSELGETFDSPAQARQQLFEYIEVFYNRKRRHSVLGYVSPALYERSVRANQSVAL
jgi:transposase InsO family protein